MRPAIQTAIQGLALLTVLTALSFNASAADPVWLQARSANFLLFTDTSEVKARRLLTDLEARVVALDAALGGIPQRQLPIEVFLFQNSVDFLETAPRPPAGSMEFNKAAYVVRGADRIFLVARDKSPEDIAEDAGHALGHVFVERLSWWRPFWLSEGAADYFRKVGRNPDTRQVTAKEGFPAADLLEIVPSSTYDDAAPPTAFRVQSHRLFRVLASEHPSQLRDFLGVLRTEAGSKAVPDVPVDTLETRLARYTETRITAPATAAAIEVREADAEIRAVHRGDLLLAAGKTSEAATWYNGESNEARAARAILYRFSRSGGEPLRVLERAARDLPDDGLLQFHFGSIETRTAADLQLQKQALERATKLLPLFGRAHAQLARVSALLGNAEFALTQLDRSMELEPEFADEHLMLRSEVYLALSRFDDARQTAELAAASPHLDRGANYNSRVADLYRRVDEARREADARKLAELRAEVAVKVAEREPPPPPPPPPPPRRFGEIQYDVQARVATEIVNAVLPTYPDALVQKGAAGNIILQATVGADGRVTRVSVSSSQLSEMNTAAMDAVRKWTFKPSVSAGKPTPFDLRIVLRFIVE